MARAEHRQNWGDRPPWQLESVSDRVGPAGSGARDRVEERSGPDERASAPNEAPPRDAGEAQDARSTEAADRLEHRVRTRLTVARGWLDLVLAERIEDPDQVAQALRTVRRQLSGLEDLLRADPAALGRDAEAGADPRTVDLLNAVEATLADYPWVSSPPVRRPVVIGRSRSLPVEPSAIHDALLHLLDNADEHTPVDTAVRVVLDYRPDSVELVVEDAGPGFPGPPGRQASRGTGLAVVEQLADRMGASVRREASAHLGGAAVRLSWQETTIVLDL